MQLDKKNKLRAIDLFAGIGGMRIGFEKAGFEIVYSNDIDKFSCITYRNNFGEIDEKDIKEVKEKNLPDFDVLLGGFPCQPFSLIGKRNGLNDPRGQLFNEIIRILDAKNPEAFVLENVKNLLKHNKGKTFSYIEEKLKNAGNGYKIYFQILDSKDFDTPQHRERIYIIGLKNIYDNFCFPKKIKQNKKVLDILENNVPEKYYLSEKYYTGLLSHKKRHEKIGSGFGCTILDKNGLSNTLVCGSMGRERNLIIDKPCKKNKWGVRKLTPRECARLQSFPEKFKITVSTTQAYKQFGNAVTVNVATAVAKSLKNCLLSPN